MEKKFRLLLLLALLLTAATGAWAQETQTWTSGDCTVTFSDGVLTVSGTGAMEDYKDYNLTPWYGKDIETIVIESGVTGIGKYALASCYNLESVSIPASMTSIGFGAFEDCGRDAATAMTVSFAEGSTPLTIGEGAFHYANLKSIDIPNRVTSIGRSAFSGCSNLESVSIPASVTSISEQAFRNCSMLANVYIFASSLTTYGADAFASNATGRKIYVLSDAVDTYKAGWSAYAADIEAMTFYATSMKVGTVDADKWTITPNPAAAGQTVTLQYTGRLKVKGVKATSDAPAKPAATVTTAPTATTGDIVAGSETALVSGGAATGGTMMYKVTTENTQPTSTEGFSADVPTAKTLAAGTYYVWYYVKADDSHTDSEISATAIAVTVKAGTPEYYNKLTQIEDDWTMQVFRLKQFGRGRATYNSSLTAAQAYALATYQAAIDGKAVYVIMSSQDDGFEIHYAVSTDASATEHTANLYDICNESNPVRMYYIAQ